MPRLRHLEESIRDFFTRRTIAYYKVVDHVGFVEELPTTASGRIQSWLGRPPRRNGGLVDIGR